jgi:hypothetical protein
VNDPTVFRRDCFKPNCATTLFNQRDSARLDGDAGFDLATQVGEHRGQRGGDRRRPALGDRPAVAVSGGEDAEPNR